jgi:hypothetical protein
MGAIASVHIADIGFAGVLATLRRAPRADGLVRADVALAAPLGGRAVPRPQFGRVGLVAFWEAEDAIERFLAAHPLAERLAGGWRASLEPLRRFGTWPGLPASVPTDRAVPHDGPAVVITLGRTRLTRIVPFLRASNRAEQSVVRSPGLLWATGLARPPFVATCSLWESTQALSTYAYGHLDPGHPDAIAADRAKPFHHQSAFVRFRPVGSEGRLGGRNPLETGALALR